MRHGPLVLGLLAFGWPAARNRSSTRETKRRHSGQLPPLLRTLPAPSLVLMKMRDASSSSSSSLQACCWPETRSKVYSNQQASLFLGRHLADAERGQTQTHTHRAQDSKIAMNISTSDKRWDILQVPTLLQRARARADDEMGETKQRESEFCQLVVGPQRDESLCGDELTRRAARQKTNTTFEPGGAARPLAEDRTLLLTDRRLTRECGAHRLEHKRWQAHSNTPAHTETGRQHSCERQACIGW